jgi:hypothetical protein
MADAEGAMPVRRAQADSQWQELGSEKSSQAHPQNGGRELRSHVYHEPWQRGTNGTESNETKVNEVTWRDIHFAMNSFGRRYGSGW